MSASHAPLTAHAPEGRKVTWPRALRSEATRFWSLRSNRWALVAALLSTALLASASTAFWNEDELPLPETGHTLEALSGIVLTQVITGVLGALMMASEYGTGSISSTTLAVPKRHWILSAKAAVLTAAVFPVGLAGGVISFFATGALLDPAQHQVQEITAPGVLTSIFGSALYLTSVALMGLGVGALIRSTAGSVVIVTAGIYILPELARMVLPGAWHDTAVAYLPSVAGEAMWLPMENPDLLSAPAGAITLLVWVCVLLALGGITIVRRDT